LWKAPGIALQSAAEEEMDSPSTSVVGVSEHATLEIPISYLTAFHFGRRCFRTCNSRNTDKLFDRFSDT
jgi:hypothetical protein